MPVPLPPKPPQVLPPRRSYAALPLLWTAVILVLTLTPANEMPRTPTWQLLSFDTAAHAGVFVVFAGLSWFTLYRQRRWPRVAHRVGVVVLVGSVLFGGLIEVLQVTMHLGRHGEWSDLLSDGLGAALAVGVATAWAARQERHRQLRANQAFLLLLTIALSISPDARGQDVARARRTIQKLASPGLHGRGYVQQGEHIAAAYLRARLRGLQLEPLAPDYTQPFALDVNTFPGKVKLRVSYGLFGDFALVGNRHHLRPGTDFIVAPNSGGGRSVAGSRLLRLDTLVFSEPTAQLQLLREIRRHRGKRQYLGALVLPARYESRLVGLPAPLPQAIDSLEARIALVAKLTASLSPVQVPQLRVELSEPWYDTFGRNTGMNTATIHIDAQLQRDYQTQNLAALIRGTAQPDSFLVLTAHYDHLGMMGRHTFFPGANDNASGVALLLELAAYYARPENRPAYSVVLLLFGAEEAGLLGSSYFVAHPLVPLQHIKFLVNLDLLGTGELGATVVNGRVLDAPYRRLVALNAAHHYLPQLAPRGRAANSDHFPFSEAGVPAFFIYTRGGSKAYHDVNDRPEGLSLAGFAGAFGLVRDFMNELGAAPSTKK